MEYAWIALTTLAQIAPPGAFAPPRVEWHSAFTNVATECLAGSELSVESECKSFGGYRLQVSPAGPELSWRGRELPRPAPESSHELAADRVEWRYRRVSEANAPARTEWRGFIYRAKAEGAPAPSYFAVRLDGDRSCALGEAASEQEARRLVEEARESCPPTPAT